ncbi:MAG: hypothetical protein AAGA76_15600, partial [Pseudomonadota bacterium]
MILKGAQRGGAKKLAMHLLNTDDNDFVEVHEVSGFLSDDVTGAFKEAQAIAKGTKCDQPFFSVALNPPQDASVTVEMFEVAVDQVAEMNGLTGQPRVIVFHEKEGRRHAHAVWSRIDAETMTAKNLPHFKNRLQSVSRDLFLEHQWKIPLGLRDRSLRSPTNVTLAEWQAAKRRGKNAIDQKKLIQQCWSISDGKAGFQAALRDHGYILAKGNRRGHVVVCHDGEVLAVARSTGLRAKAVRERLGEPDNLPSVDDAMAQHTKDIRGQFVRMAGARQWDAHSGDVIHTLKGHSEKVIDAVFSPDGRQLLTASADYTARIWDADNGELVHVLEGHEDVVTRALFSQDGSKVVTASGDSSARIWDARSGETSHLLEGHDNWVFHAEFSPDGGKVVTASADRTARIWDINPPNIGHTKKSHSKRTVNNAYSIGCASFSKDGRKVLTVSSNGAAQIWDARSGNLKHSLEGSADVICTAVLSQSGSKALTASDDNTARLWDATSGDLIHTLKGHADLIITAAVSQDDSKALTASDDHTARIWNTKSGDLIHTLKGHTASLCSAAFSPDGTKVLTASCDYTARLWDTT